VKRHANLERLPWANAELAKPFLHLDSAEAWLSCTENRENPVARVLDNPPPVLVEALLNDAVMLGKGRGHLLVVAFP
jgi:hypothetical protein